MKRLFIVLAAGLACASLSAAPKRPSAKAPAGASQSEWRCSPYVGAIAANAETGDIVFEKNADRLAYPASVTKLMTLLLVLEDVRASRYGLDDIVTATDAAYQSEPSWIGIKAGETMSVRNLCLALMVESANDAAIVLGVHSAGSFDAFVARMNARAKELGMAKTIYYNPNGLPPNAAKHYPWKAFNVTTARDQLILARALVKLPEVFFFTSVKTCDLVKTTGGYRVFVTRRVNESERKTELADGEKIVKSMSNHNNVMRMDKLKLRNPDGREAVDGLKTGYINDGGSSIVLTGMRNGKRAIVVVLGSSSSNERDGCARQLLVDALGALVW